MGSLGCDLPSKPRVLLMEGQRLLLMEGLNHRPQDIRILILLTCVYVASHSRRDSVDVMESRMLRWEMIQDYPGGPSLIASVLTRGKQRQI